MERLEFTRYAEENGTTLIKELSVFIPVDESHPRARSLPDFTGFWMLIVITNQLSIFDFRADMEATEKGVPLWEGPVADTHLRPGVVIISIENFNARWAQKQQQRFESEVEIAKADQAAQQTVIMKLKDLGLTEEEANRIVR